MSPDRNDLDLSMLPPEHRAAFEAMQRRVNVLAEADKRQEALIHCPAVHSKGMS